VKNKKTKSSQQAESEWVRKLTRKFEPDTFYVDTLFDPESDEARMWRSCWIFEKWLIPPAVLAVYFSVWWALPVLFFPFSVSWSIRNLIRNCSGGGYPYPEPRSYTGVVFNSILSGLFCFVWLVLAI
jgi:hypothetical protein